MKRLLFLLILALTLSGCVPSPSPSPVSEERSATWTPPENLPTDLSEDALSAMNALSLCKTFAEDMSALYPEYAPILSDADVAYYEKRFADPSTALSDLSAELSLTIVALRQQVYLSMEETTKLHKPLPDGLEQFVRDFEASLHEIGW